jgi:hypothetical protein
VAAYGIETVPVFTAPESLVYMNPNAPEVTDKALAGLPSFVANEIVSAVLVPVTTASEVGLGVPRMLSSAVAR